jgi:hypothetical protein
MLSGKVRIDLVKVEPDRARSRLACLASLPDGVRCEVIVGALAANMPACRVLADEADRLDIDVVGEARAVQFWLEAARDPDVFQWGAP